MQSDANAASEKKNEKTDSRTPLFHGKHRRVEVRGLPAAGPGGAAAVRLAQG